MRQEIVGSKHKGGRMVVKIPFLYATRTTDKAKKEREAERNYLKKIKEVFVALEYKEKLASGKN